MPGFGRFGRRWASTGVVSEPTANQADAGFAYLGANPPTVELFNSLEQMNDERHNWTFARISEVLAAGGVSPTENTANQLLTALRALFAPGMIAFGRSGNFVVPATVSKLLVKVWGGGGGGGGAYGPNAAGSGGGAGGYAEGVYTVTPGSSIFVTIGLGGGGSEPSAIYTAKSGGTTSFGSFCSATGGAPGSGALNGVVATSGAGGAGTGGTLNLPGGGGGLGQSYSNGTGGGIGGCSPFGGAPSSLSLGSNGNNGNFPGGGGTGAGMRGAANAAENYAGGSGADGLCLVYW